MVSYLLSSLPSTFEEMHHAYFVVGNPTNAQGVLESMLTPFLDREMHNHPDVSSQIYGIFSINDAHTLQDQAYLKPVLQSHRIFCIYAWSMTIEAQNTLLKLFEEPSPTSRFFVCTPRLDTLIPPLYSRVEYLGRINDEEDSFDTIPNPHTFISVSPHERLKLIEDIISTKDSERAQYFIGELEKVYVTVGGKKERGEAFGFLWSAVRMIEDNNVGLKMVLEHLSLVLPVVQNK